MFEPGEWYLVVTCHNCKTMLKLFRDPDNRIFSPSGDYILTCAECDHKGAYSMHQVARYRHPEEKQF